MIDQVTQNTLKFRWKKKKAHVTINCPVRLDYSSRLDFAVSTAHANAECLAEERHRNLVYKHKDEQITQQVYV